MAETAHTAWYRQGLVSVTNGSTKVSGNGTKFLTAGINPGASFRIDARGDYACEVAEVVSDTELRLAMPYYGQSATNQTYSIDRNHQSTMLADLSSRLARAQGCWEGRYDLDMQTITGKSAYEEAKELGLTRAATFAAWLEELKAGGELAALKALVDPILVHNSGTHNALPRGKNLGVFSDAQSAAIRSGAFAATTGGVYADVYCADYWSFSNIPYTYLDENDEEQSSTYSGTMRVAACDYEYLTGSTSLTTHHVVVVPDSPMFSAPMNETNTTEGGYVGSKMRTVSLRRAEAIFKACFGENHVLKHQELLVTAVRDGRASGGGWCDSYVELMDECMVYGSHQLDSGSPDGVTIPYRYSLSCKQLSLFQHRPDLIHSRNGWYWLRNVVSAAYFAGVHSGGNCGCHVASYSGGVRPAALIY